ncbi:MAG: PEGA domain-containing protein [Deltaproteobacteria bacterium]|nr:MAG: PEGA domain-containing protein [Deltaproteobacteria bacterium]
MRVVAVTMVFAFAAVADLSVLPSGALTVRGAHAAESGAKRRVALFVVPKRRGGDGEAKVLESLLRGELGKLRGIVAVGVNNDPAVPITRTAGPLVEEGFRALNDKQAGEAVDAFSKAFDLVTTYRGPFDRRLFARTLKGFGVASVLNGNIPDAERMIVAALNVWPDQQVGEYGWTLDSRTTFRDIERKRSEAALGSIEVTTEPDGAEVHVDGVLRGFAPVEVGDLAIGEHWVEATIDGRTRAGTLIMVQPGEGSIAYLELDEAADGRTFRAAMANVARLMRSNQVASPLSQVQRIAAADAVIVLEVDKSGGAYTFEGWSRSGAGDVERQRVSLNEDAQLLENAGNFLAGILGTEPAPDDDMVALDAPPQSSVMGGGDLFIDPNDPIFKQDEKKKTKPITETWWFWTIAGGITTALVVGGIVLFSGSDSGSGPTGNVIVNMHGLQ